jgi:HD-GYP domain-containing protein (c-di-GMP phosphodiesterase class II)
MPDGVSNTATEAGAENEAHYIKAVAEIGDRRTLAVTQPIYAANGIKLLEAGASLTSRTLERLVGHRLAAPIENCLAAEGSVRVADVVTRARDLAEAQPLLAQLIAPEGRSARVWTALGNAPLPASVLFRLTVAREKFGTLHDHSLRAAVVALVTGAGARLGERELELLATAALMHDFGMLHADPAAFEHDRPLDNTARRQLRAHPLTGMLIAQREPQLNPAIGMAILQHHERLDRSGYPSAPAPERIARLPRILMLVEIVLAMVEHRPQLPELQLSLILRANHRGFDRELANVLLAALPRAKIDGSGPTSGEAPAVAQLARRLADWHAIKGQAAEGVARDAHGFVSERLVRPRRFLTEAGIDPIGAGGASFALGDDAAAQAELNGLTAEALWQVRQIASEAMMQWPHLGAADATPAPERPAQALSKWLIDAMQPVAASAD